MTKRGQPKFTLGDTVVIAKDGITSTINKIVNHDGNWYYSLENNENLYAECNLLFQKEYEKSFQKRENINIEYKYHFGDIVRVKGYGQELFVIIGFRAEIWRYKESSWEDIIYELSRITDGQWLEAAEEELTYITNEDNAKKLINAKKQTAAKNQLLISPQKTQSRTKEISDIDSLLDMYNDYLFLYQNFGEAGYKKKMREILRKLEAIAQNPFRKET